MIQTYTPTQTIERPLISQLRSRYAQRQRTEAREIQIFRAKNRGFIRAAKKYYQYQRDGMDPIALNWASMNLLADLKLLYKDASPIVQDSLAKEFEQLKVNLEYLSSN